MSGLPDKLTANRVVFLPYQQELLASSALYGVTVIEKSRRTGYSWAAAAIAVMTAGAARSAGGMNVFYMGYNYEMAREFIGYCAMWARELQIAAGEMEETFFDDPEHPERQVKQFRMELASGFSIVALPSMARALRGKQGLVIIDEAAFHDELDAVIDAALALRMWGGRVLIISTHKGDENPFNALVQDIRAGKRPFKLLRCTLDDALEQGLFKQICLVKKEEWSAEKEAAWRAQIFAEYGAAADQELLCIPSEGGGTAIPRALIEKRMVEAPVLRFACDSKFVHLPDFIREADVREWCERELKPLLEKLDPDIPTMFGQDFARKGDVSSIVPIQLLKSLLRRVPFIVEMRNVPFEQQRQILFYIVDRLPKMRAGKLDATGNGAYLAEVAMQRYGELRVEMVMMSEPWYRENMPPMKAAFEDALIELPRDRDVIDDIALLKFVRGVIRVPERTLNEDGEGRHGDTAIALALAYAASLADPEEYGYEAGDTKPRGLGPGGANPINKMAMRDWAEEEDRGQVGNRGMLPVLRPL